MTEDPGVMFCLEEFSGEYLRLLQILLKVHGPLVLCGKTELFCNRQVMVGLGTLHAMYVIWQKPCDRHSHHECHFNPCSPSGSREVLYLFLFTSVDLASLHFLYPSSLVKHSSLYLTLNFWSVTSSLKESVKALCCSSHS